jgi:hypothetical protein
VAGGFSYRRKSRIRHHFLKPLRLVGATSPDEEHPSPRQPPAIGRRPDRNRQRR